LYLPHFGAGAIHFARYLPLFEARICFLQRVGARTSHFAWYLQHFGTRTSHFSRYLQHVGGGTLHVVRYLQHFEAKPLMLQTIHFA
jgi:hypothetical protein